MKMERSLPAALPIIDSFIKADNSITHVLLHVRTRFRTLNRFLIVLIVLSLRIPFANAQSFYDSTQMDSIFNRILTKVPADKRNEVQNEYSKSSNQDKQFILFMLSMQQSSKKELIDNIDTNYRKINLLRTEYAKLVPIHFTVSIEFNPENPIIRSEKSVDMMIRNIENKETTVIQNWNMTYQSDTLKNMLALVNWSMQTLEIIKKLLSDAHCISIENGKIATIGFARSGMGKYFYKLFDSNLSIEEIKQFNDGCTYIYFKNNIVLEFGGGAVGRQCFPEE